MRDQLCMITFFTVPKPFNGHIGIIQGNAIHSWQHVDHDCQIILFGDDYGIEQFATEHNLTHIPNVEKNAYGTPLLDSVFQKAQQIACNDIMVYVNTDIIFLEDLIPAIKKVPFDQFVLTGRRNDIDINKQIQFDDSHCTKFVECAKHNAKMLTPSGMDYFVFKKGSIKNIPPFTVGRKGWDNWFIFNARKNHIPVVDISASVFATHQNHNYEHIQNKYQSNYEGPESDQNIALINNKRIYRWEIEDANWLLMQDLLEKKRLNMREVFRQGILYTPIPLHFIFEIVLICRHHLTKK